MQKAVEYLGYTHNYYPSGSKQVTGSQLDEIVERARTAAENQIIVLLRRRCDEDFGNDAEIWIREFDAGVDPTSERS